MEVKAGYKQTDIGIIPEDWDVNAVESTTPPNRPNGIVDGPFGSNLKTIHYRKSGIPIITSGYVTEGKFFASEYLFVDKEKFRQEKRSAVNPGDIVMAKIGARCGASAILPKDHEVGILSGNALKITVDNSHHSTYYVWQVLWNLYSRGNIEELRTVGAQPAISMANLKKYKIPLPPLPEQEAIAEALSDADALIEALEKLIAKKRQVKQGAMQELLTGKRRLLGFSEKWETKKLGDVFEVTAGGDFDPTQASDTQDERFPYPIYSNALTNKGLYGFSSYNNHQAGSITVTARGTLGNANYRDRDFTAIGRVIVLKPTQPLDGRFISEFINNRIDFVVESTGVPQLTAPQISKYEILFPEFPEQTAIAEILSDMDAEIAALEAKLAKARQVKQGMMQELLTGRIRLV